MFVDCHVYTRDSFYRCCCCTAVVVNYHVYTRDSFHCCSKMLLSPIMSTQGTASNVVQSCCCQLSCLYKGQLPMLFKAVVVNYHVYTRTSFQCCSKLLLSYRHVCQLSWLYKAQLPQMLLLHRRICQSSCMYNAQISQLLLSHRRDYQLSCLHKAPLLSTA